MQIVVSSFDAIAGCGAAKPYTAVALQTISRHFRCLKDTINSQIQATRKSLGEQDTLEDDKGIRITRLRYVEQQLRQQKALQQLGMMPQHAWRPQRGLPESSVSILRAWLFEHFLHPYVFKIIPPLCLMIPKPFRNSIVLIFFFYCPPATRKIPRRSC